MTHVARVSIVVTTLSGEAAVGYELEQVFAAVHDFLASTIRAAGPWAIPMVIASAGLVAMANRGRLLSGFGVFLVLATAALVTIVIAFQTGRV